MNELVSVIIPTYNGGKTINRCLRSVVNQSYENLEIIVIIDKATNDNSLDVIESISDSRIKIIKSDKERSASYNRNLGIKASNGQYISFIDDDDEWEKEKISSQVNFLENNKQYYTVLSNYTFISETKRKKYNTFSTNYSKDILLMNIKLAAGSNILVKREEIFRANLFDDRFFGHQDLEITIRLDELHPVGHINEYLVNIYGRSGRVLSNASKVLKIKELFLNVFKTRINNYNKGIQNEIYAKHYLQVSRAFAFENNFKTSFEYLKLSLSFKLLFSKIFKIIPYESYFVILYRYLLIVFGRK